MRERVDLTAEIRVATGKGPARRLRMRNRIPAILYGPATAPMSLSLDESALIKAFGAATRATSLYNLTIQGGEQPIQKTTMLKDFQRDPLSRRVLHVDFYEVDLAKTLTVDVPVRLEGAPVGLDKGGVMEQIRHEVTVSCLPTNIPEAIVIDVTHLDLGDSLHVRDVPIGEGIEILADTDFTIAAIVAPSAEVPPAEESEETAASEE